MKTKSRPAIVLLATGGTIASVPVGDAEGAVPRLTARELVESVPGLDERADIECIQYAQKPSVELDFEDIQALLGACHRAVDAGADGVIVTQGTDTIEETSYLLDLLWDREEPVVVTGAMRNPSLAGSDGPANLLAAMQVAASRDGQGRGVLVVLNDEIHAARDVVKTHTSSTSAFRSWRTGPVGVVHEGQPHFHVRPHRLPPLEADFGAVPPIALVTATLGDGIPYLEALPAWGYRGVVIEAFGGGHVRSSIVPTIETLAQRMPVVLASRTGAGATLTNTYAFPGSEADLLRVGAIPAGSLHALKARLLLSVLLARGADQATIRGEFAVRG